jgi:hypothetical protein
VSASRVVAFAVAAAILVFARDGLCAPHTDVSDPAACVERTTAMLNGQNLPGTRLVRAACEEALGQLLLALADARQAWKDATALRDASTARAARERAGGLVPRIPQITLTPPQDVADLKVTLDEKYVPPERLGRRFFVDPGTHSVHAEATLDGVPVVFDKEVDVKERDILSVPIALAPSKPEAVPTTQLKCLLAAKTQEEAARCFPQHAEFLTQGQLDCLLSAKNQQEVDQCLPHKEPSLIVKAGSEVSAYGDSTNVNVLSPAINGTVASPTAGWRVGGSYLVDVVSAASPDIVSEASPPFREVRNAGTLNGAYKRGVYGAEASGNVSSEPDYLALGAGIAVTADLNDKLITPRLGFNYSHDTIGRSTTPFSVFHHTLETSEIEAGTTLVMSATSVLLLSGTLQLERGDQSKPYRYIPMFEPATAAQVRPGQSYASVNAAREPMRPLEQLPLARDRYAIGARFAHRFGGSTLRVEQRLYYDSWREGATTTDLRFMADLSDRFRFWPHVRVNAQNGANFYRLAYSPVLDPVTNHVAVPTYRTGDRELSPLVTVTGGGGLRIALTPSTSSTQAALTLQGDVMYTKYFDALYITSRTAAYTTVGLDMEFE